MTHIYTNKCINQHFIDNFLKIFIFSLSSLLFGHISYKISNVLLKKISGKCWKGAVRKGYHIKKSPSGYQSILTNFEAWIYGGEKGVAVDTYRAGGHIGKKEEYSIKVGI